MTNKAPDLNKQKELRAIATLERITGLTLKTDKKSLVLPYVSSGRGFIADAVWLAPEGCAYKGVCVEIQGGIHNGGKHGRGSGIEIDYLKCNIAQAGGWMWFTTSYSKLKTNAQLLTSMSLRIFEKAHDDLPEDFC